MLSAFLSHNVHLIYLENNSDLQLFPVVFFNLMIYADVLGVTSLSRASCDFSEDTAGLGQRALPGLGQRLLNRMPTATEHAHNLKATCCGVSKQSAF